MPRPILIDCDPGTDDAIALAMAVASPELEILGVVTTYGNVGIEHTSRNALRVLEWLGSDVPVYRGATRSLLSPRIDASQFHGESGLDAPAMGPPRRTAESGGVEFIVRTLLQHPEPLTVVATGPLTNLALAIRLEPAILPRIERIVLMGGSTDFGNDSPAAEFNLLCDPHAAQIVFTSDVDIVMFGLNVTHQVIASREEVDAVLAIGNESAEVFAGIMSKFEGEYVERYRFGAAMHDPCTIAYLLDPSIFTFRRMHVDVDTNTGISFGRTVHDIWNWSGQPQNVEVAMIADAPRFFQLLRACLARLR